MAWDRLFDAAKHQILAEVNRAGTWFTYTIMSSFVDMVGLTPVHRKEAVHAIAVATRDAGIAAIEEGDSEVAELCLRFFNTYLRAAINQTAPTFASVIMNEYRRFAIGALEWRPDLSVEAAAHVLRYGRHFDDAGMPATLGAAAEDVADLAIEARARDPQVSLKLARLLVRNLLDLTPNARPIGLNGMFKGVAKLTFWAMAADQRDIARVLVEGIAAAPPDFVDAALDREKMLLYPFCRLTDTANVLIMPAFHSASISTNISGETSALTAIREVAGRIFRKNSPCALPTFSQSAILVT